MDLLCEHGFVGAYQQCEHEARQIIPDLDFGVPISQMLRHVELRRLLQTFVRRSIVGAFEPLLFKSIEGKSEEGINACFVFVFFPSERTDMLTFASGIDCSVYCTEAVTLSSHLSQVGAGGGGKSPS